LREDGIDIRLGRHATAARRDGDAAVVELDDGTSVRADVVVLGARRRPRTDGLGLDTAGIELNPRGGLDVDEHCSVTDGLWALVERAVVGAGVDAPQLLIRQVRQLWGVGPSRQGQEPEDDVTVYMDRVK
jgi:NADPH-dependent 2,4-dienoyl-CoA reductase/sulfur reductase-like enzyme